MNARIAFKKKKIVSERSLWIVSIYDKPYDIVRYDKRTTQRLVNEVYGKKSKVAEKGIIIRSITDKIFLNYSNLTKDEHQRQNK
jgi:hypothetical protein